MKKNNIIIFRTDRLGDYLIHSRPIYELKRKIKNSHIIVVCSQINKKILSNTSYVDEVIVFNKNFNFLKKTKVFINLIKKQYHSCFILDGKKFSFFVNMFLFSKKKFGVIYKKKINTKYFKIDIFKPSKIYANLFFTKFEVFTSKKYLAKIESFQQKYINLFNYYGLNNYII
jgi:ADP-heptose:LPS heptosyltransferase